jgi:phosphoglycolate phosphatase-like HAD superfamily hydrolase
MHLVPDRPRRLEAVVLDVDGTLVDSNDAHARAWVDAFAEAGIVVEYDRVRRAIGMGGDKLMPHVSGLSEDSPEGARISARRHEIFTSRYFPDVRPFPRVRELVQRFVDDGYTCVVASSATREDLRALLERANVSDLIAIETSSDDAERSKPDPDIVRAALQRAGKPAAATVMLGDTPYDVEAALRAGIRIVGVECGGWTRRDLAGVSQAFASPADLLERYDQSIFSSASAAAAAARSNRTEPPAIDVRILGVIAAGVAGAALLFLAARALRRRSRSEEETGGGDSPHWHRPGLGARDRERLRHLIERTS